MKSLLRLLSVFVVFSLVVFSPGTAFADPKLMPLGSVQKLIDSSPNKTVNAHFHTVLKGTKIESLQVVIRGIFRQPGLEIIVFTSKHQIAAGMSGSPVHVNGKLVGAVAYSFNGYSKEHWGGISPISLMAADANAGNNKLIRSFDYEGKTFVPIALGFETIPGSDIFANQKFIKTTNSGGSGSASSDLDRAVLKPGMPIVVDLVDWTDENGKTSTLGATGTITYVDDKGKVFAFGHPFYNSKNVVYGFRTAEIIGTISSDDPARNFKLTGRTSDVLGAITYDSSYGIYGKIGAKEELKRLRHFNLEFKSKGVSSHKFDIKVADSVMTPILVQVAFAMIGNEYGAPLAQETSVTQIESQIDLESYQSILWKGLYPSGRSIFGPQIIYSSSFTVACESFFNGIYGYVSGSNYGLKISDVSVSVNFISGARQTYKLGDYKFSNKVIYGQDPVLEVMFVDENNSMPIVKRITIKVDWDKIERPIYTSETNDTEKVSEKVVGGMLAIQSSKFYLLNLSSEESQKIIPGYFLNAEDFLESLSRRLDITNQKVFVKVGFRSRSGLFDEVMAKSDDIIPSGILPNESGWHVIEGGLKERKVTLKDNGVVVFNVNLPDAPNGYVFDQEINEGIQFEIVIEK